jgi:hypothetical protein
MLAYVLKNIILKINKFDNFIHDFNIKKLMYKGNTFIEQENLMSCCVFSESDTTLLLVRGPQGK